MKNSMVDFFIDRLDLKELPKKQRLFILKSVLRYLMGLEKYTITKNKLNKFKRGKAFLVTLKSMSKPEIVYIRNLRKYAITFNNKIDIKDRDKTWVCRFVKSSNWFIDVADYDFILEDEILKQMYPSIVSTSSMLKSNLSYDNSVSVKDLINSFYIKTLETYRVYICSCSKDFNDKMLYSCLHRGLSSKKIDILRGYDTNKTKILKNTVPIDFIENL